jgi:2-succinyl-6-hydroxy-2,4-cyclohexadiene-1-carboxylate synthase
MRLVLLHGFTQSPETWVPVWSRLPEAIEGEPVEVLAPQVPDGLDFASTARSVLGTCGPGVYCGYSMGGRLCLRGALDNPGLVRGLVLVSASAGISDDAARARRAQADDELAADVRRLGVEEFVRRWLAQPMFSTLGALGAPQGGEEEVSRRTAGTSVERLEHQLRVLGQGAQQSMWDRLRELRMPTAVVTGRNDLKYEAIGDAMAASLPACIRMHLDGGHSLPLEQPAAVATVLADMLRLVRAHGSAP